MTLVPELKRLVRQVVDDPESALIQVLLLVCEQLDMRIAVLGTIAEEIHTVDVAVRAGFGRDRSLEGSRPVGESFCSRVPENASLVVTDIATVPELAGLEVTQLLDVGCYAGTTLRDASGAVVGVLGLLGHGPHQRMDRRDVIVLEELADVVVERYTAWRRASDDVPEETSRPSGDEPKGGSAGDSVATLGVTADDLQGLTRPLLYALYELSGIASTYLTAIDEVGNRQQPVLVHNGTSDLTVPEGAIIGWEQSMCWLALHQGTPAIHDLPQRWPQVEVARALGLVTHLSVPVRLSDGSLWGTLCASDVVSHHDSAAHVQTLTVFARLIAAEDIPAEFDRLDRALESARVEAEEAEADARRRIGPQHAQRLAETDELTGCANRRRVDPWIRSAAAVAPEQVMGLAFIDVNRFKGVNDRYGHAVGDAVLRTLGQRLLRTVRPDDLVARLGGDEFIACARLSRTAMQDFEDRVREAVGFTVPTEAGELQVHCSIGFASSDDGSDPDELLRLADSRMYRNKASRA